MQGWRNYTTKNPCPICGRPTQGHTSRWCSITLDGELAVCHFESAGAIRTTRDGGWLHALRPQGVSKRSGGVSTYQTPYRPARATRTTNWPLLVNLYQRNVDLPELNQMATGLGLEAASLVRLGVGCFGDTWTFPMVNERQVPVGIRTRLSNGDKRSVFGSRNGLFIPHDFAPNGGPLVICEGATDTAAMLSLGLCAVGRADCGTGLRYLKPLCAGRAVLIIGDNDVPGRFGAHQLADSLDNARVVFPPDHIKDAREWVRHGATAAEVKGC